MKKQKKPQYLYYQTPVFGSEDYKQLSVVLFFPHSYRLDLDRIDSYFFSKSRYRSHTDETKIERIRKKILRKSNDDLFRKCLGAWS